MGTSEGPVKFIHYTTIALVLFALAWEMPIFFNIAGGLMLGCGLGSIMRWKLKLKLMEAVNKQHEEDTLKMESIIERLKNLRD